MRFRAFPERATWISAMALGFRGPPGVARRLGLPPLLATTFPATRSIGPPAPRSRSSIFLPTCGKPSCGCLSLSLGDSLLLAPEEAFDVFKRCIEMGSSHHAVAICLDQHVEPMVIEVNAPGPAALHYVAKAARPPAELVLPNLLFGVFHCVMPGMNVHQ
jgi:hypothetical protein